MNIADDGVTAKGSGRSIEAYHLFNALEPAKDKMVHFGGHHMAVGLTAKTAELSAIHAQMEAAAATMLKTVPKPALPIAARLEVGDLTLEHYELIRRLAPFGQGNPEPTFSVRPQVVQNVKPIGKE
ncbi:single-stranded DNA-binding protein, partial [Lacticaseibacillus rhamnosus]